MKAWQVCRLGEPRDAMELGEVPDPRPSDRQVVVRVGAAALNFPDVLMCRGQYQVRPDLPFTPGIEVCGQIVELGSAVDAFAVGDRVLGSTALPSGGFAESALMETSATFLAPSSLADDEASALHVGYQTGWFGLSRRANLKSGETLLVHAAAGGVGSAAVQLGKAMGARVIAVVSSPAKADVARRLGADVVIDRKAQDFVEVVKEETSGLGADVVYDPVGGETYQRSTKCVAFEGRIVLVGFAGGEIQSAALNHALIKNYSILGLHWGLYDRRNPAAVAECHRTLTDLADRQLIRPLVSERLAIADAAHGLQRLADGTTVGRLVLEP